MTRRDFFVTCPEELLNAAQFLKNAGQTDRMIKNWSWYRDKGKTCPMDKHLFIRFESNDEGRKCTLVQIAGNGHCTVHAEYRYNLMLKYCRDELTEHSCS